jgi:DNA primase
MSAYPKEFITDLKAKVDIVDVLSQYIELKQLGSIYKGSCPFHDDSDPSFTVYPGTGTFYCFSCGAGSRDQKSDIIEFVKTMEKCSFPEAVKKIIDWTGMTPDSYMDPELAKAKKNIFKLMMNNHAALLRDEEAMSFLYARGILREEIEKYNLGVTTYEGNKRISIPICDEFGSAIGFSYRAIGDIKPKYVNSKNDHMFVKSDILWGLSNVKNEIRNCGYVVIVEGYFDAIALQRHGIPAVAIMTASISENQAKLITKYTKSAIIFMDNDEGGFQNQNLIADRLFESGLTAKIVIHDFGKRDPDDIEKYLGESVASFIEEKAHVLSEYLVSKEINAYSEKVSELKRITLMNIKPLYKKLSNAVDKDLTLKALSRDLNIDIEAIKSYMEQ